MFCMVVPVNSYCFRKHYSTGLFNKDVESFLGGNDGIVMSACSPLNERIIGRAVRMFACVFLCMSVYRVAQSQFTERQYANSFRLIGYILY